MVRIQNVGHIINVPSINYKNTVYITTSNVSFKNISVKELSVKSVATGFLLPANNDPHEEWEDFRPVWDLVPGKGSELSVFDNL